MEKFILDPNISILQESTIQDKDVVYLQGFLQALVY